MDVIKVSDNTEQIIIKAAGANAKIMTKEDFYKLYSRQPVFITDTRFYKNFGAQKGVWEEQTLTITVNLTARERVYNDNGKWIDTKPLTIHMPVIKPKVIKFPGADILSNLPAKLVTIDYTLVALDKPRNFVNMVWCGIN